MWLLLPFVLLFILYRLNGVYWLLGWLVYLTTKKDTAKRVAGSLAISYVYQGRDYILYVPFRRRLAIEGLRQTTYLVKEGNYTPFYQQAGIPLLVEAADLGVDRIVVEEDS